MKKIFVLVLILVLLSSLVSASTRDVIEVDGLRIVDETSTSITRMEVIVSMNDLSDYDLDNVMVTTMIPEINVFHKIRINLEDLDENRKSFYVDIPRDISKGEYPVRFMVSSDDTKRIKYRYLVVY